MTDAVGPREIVSFVIRLAAGAAISYFVVRKLTEFLDPTFLQKKKSKFIAEKIMKQLGVKNIEELSEYELTIATHLISNNTDGSWDEVGGYAEQIKDLQDNVILPLKVSCKSKIFSPPSGVLLYGPPGCGKTLIAKAVAKAAGARFINLQVSSLTDKWYGESEKLTAAVFSLAKKIQPVIIFIDEIDSFLRSRQSHDHETTAIMKALFMSLWDGFATEKGHRIIILGATNRPQDVDPAILRRMPCRHFVGLPTDDERHLILEVMLKNEQMDKSVDLEHTAALTNGFSGSDLKEIVRIASICRVKETVLRGEETSEASIRPMSQQDLTYAVEKCKQCRKMSLLDHIHNF